MIYYSISIYIIKFIYIIIYINSYSLSLHFENSKKYQVPSTKVPFFAVFYPKLISCKIRAKIEGQKSRILALLFARPLKISYLCIVNRNDGF